MASTVFNISYVSDNPLIESIIDPTPADYNYEIGTRWINTNLDKTWTMTDNSVGIANWVLTSNESSSGGYITAIIDPYNETVYNGTVLDSTMAKSCIWYVSMSDNTSSSNIIFTIEVSNDENAQDFMLSSSDNGANNSGCNMRVTFPSDGTANLEGTVTDSDWKIVIKRLDF